MYNRYIPQSDGSYRRNQMQDIPRQNSPPQHRTCPSSEVKCEVPPPPPCSCKKPAKSHPRQEMPVPGFLRQLLPKDFDTADLLVVILLLLMTGDCEDDQNWALLTLVLYLFL